MTPGYLCLGCQLQAFSVGVCDRPWGYRDPSEQRVPLTVQSSMAGFTLSSDPLSALWPGKDTDFRDALSFKKSSKFFLNFQCALPSLYCDSFQVIPKDPPSSVTPSFLSLAQSPRGQSTLKVDKDKNSLFLFLHLPVNPNPDKPKALIVWPLSHSPDASTVTLFYKHLCELDAATGLPASL